MFVILFTMLALHSPPVLPPPPADNPPAQAEPTLDELVRNAPLEIREYCKAATQERLRRANEAAATARQLEHDLKLIRAGRVIVPKRRQGRYSAPAAPAPDVAFITDDGPPRYEFGKLEVKTKMIREARSAIENAQAMERYYRREDVFIHPTIDQFELGAMGVWLHTDQMRCVAQQVVDASNVLVRIEAQGIARYASHVPDLSRPDQFESFPIYDGIWRTRLTAWLEGVDTTKMTDGHQIDISGIPLLVDRSRTYETAIGGSNTVLNIRVLDLRAHLPLQFFTDKEPQR